MKTSPCIALCLLAFAIDDTCHASWADIPLEVLVRTEKLIVTGKLGDVAPVEIRDAKRAMAAGDIEIDTVLKNEIEGLDLDRGDTVQLVMPSREGGLRISTDIIFKPGTEGVWLLERRPDGGFEATYPKDYQQLATLKEIETALRKAERSILVELNCHLPKPRTPVKAAAIVATLYEYDPLLADAAAKQVDQKKLSPVGIIAGRDARFNFTLGADRTERRQYYVTVFVHMSADIDKRIYFVDGFNKVCESGNYQKLQMTLKPAGRR